MQGVFQRVPEIVKDAAEKGALFVLAGSYAQFRGWCASHHVPEHTGLVRYVGSPFDLYSAPQGVRYTTTGTWTDRRDLTEVNQLLWARGAQWVRT